MRHSDFLPLYRATVGFDKIADLMDRILASDGASRARPHLNIEKIADDVYHISITVAGFSADDISVEIKESALNIAAGKNDASEEKTYLYSGIANRAFEKRFQLADHVRVNTASQINGLLHVDFIREVPETLKLRHIEIMSAEIKVLPDKAIN